MKKLVLFGDSFANMNGSWASHTAILVGCPLVNFGHCASAIDYSLDQFAQYVTSLEYDVDDIIIFVITSPHRLHVPGMPSPALSVGPEWCVPTTNEEVAWINTNKNWFNETISKLDGHASFNIPKAIAILQSWASTHANNTVVAIQAFHDLSKFNLRDLVQQTNNFYPITMHPLLIDVSMAEFSSPELHTRCALKTAEKRTNHLSGINLVLLAEMIADVIKHSDTSYYDPTRFIKNLYLTEDDYNKYENPRN